MEHSPGFEKLCEAARANVTEVPAEEIAARIAKGEAFGLIDVREVSEFRAGHLPSARSIGRGILERDIERAYPDAATALVLYCGGGYRSALAAESLQKMGYRNVTSMAGGWRGWVEKAFPTVT